MLTKSLAQTTVTVFSSRVSWEPIVTICRNLGSCNKTPLRQLTPLPKVEPILLFYTKKKHNDMFATCPISFEMQLYRPKQTYTNLS